MNAGLKYLEAFPQPRYVGLSGRDAGNRDQKWQIKFLRRDDSRHDAHFDVYLITCDTVNRGVKAIEACPQHKHDGKNTGIVRPVDVSDACVDQQWGIENIGGNRFKLYCHTENRGLRYLEAYPNYGFAGASEPRGEGADRDQVWMIEPVPDFLREANVNIVAHLRNFTFENYDSMLRLEEQQARDQLSLAEYKTLIADFPGVTLSGEHKRRETAEFTYGFEEMLGLGMKVSFAAGVPPFISATTTFSAEFTFTADQSWTSTIDEEVTERYAFTAPEAGEYRISVVSRRMDGFRLPFTATLTYRGYLADGSQVSAEGLRAAMSAQYPLINLDDPRAHFSETADGKAFMRRDFRGHCTAKSASMTSYRFTKV
jgi:hypothetical protein